MAIEEKFAVVKSLDEGDTNQIYLTEDGDILKIFPNFSFPLVVQSLGRLLIGRVSYLKAEDRIKAEIEIRSELEELGLSYPQIIDRGEKWLKIEYIEGENVKSFLETNPSKSEDLGGRTAELMKRLHQNNVILEDWDLNNILVREDKFFFVDLEYGRFSDRKIDRAIDPINMLMVLRTLEPQIYEEFLTGFKQKYQVGGLAKLFSIFFALGWSVANSNLEGIANTFKSVKSDLKRI